jgi:hypothetical protein
MWHEFPAAPVVARPEPATAPPPSRAPAWLRDWMALTGPLVTLVLMLSGLAARPYWGDEADTISAVRRSVPRPVLDRRERGVHRIWVVQTASGQRPAGYLLPGFRLAHEWHLAGGPTAVWLYTKARPGE